MKLSDLREGDTIRYQTAGLNIAEGVITDLDSDDRTEFPIEIKSARTGLLCILRISEVIEVCA